MIKTSVIIPVYNTAEYLEEAIESVLAQTQKEIEIFLIDDGSCDGSLEIIDRYIRQYPFIYKITQEHEYQGTARNKGFYRAKGKYIYFMDSDDAILPDLFERCYETCENMNLDFVTFDAYGFRYDENDTELKVPDDIFDRQTLGIENRIYSGEEFWNSFYDHHGILYLCWLHYIRRDFIENHKLLFEERTYFEDNDWILRMYMAAGRLYYIPMQLHRHRWRRNSNMLGGFTSGLMKGCLRMHKVLLRLYLNCTEEAKLSMINDVIRLNIRRFDRLREVEPTKEYTEPLQKFAEELKKHLNDPEISNREYYVHFACADRMIRAVRTWKDKSFYQSCRNIVQDTFALRHPLFGQNKNIAIYGTGQLSRCLISALNEYYKDIRCRISFIHTKKPTGEEFLGFQVFNITDVRKDDFDIIIIGSIKFRDSIMDEIEKHLGGETAVMCLPREFQYLQDDHIDNDGRSFKCV